MRTWRAIGVVVVLGVAAAGLAAQTHDHTGAAPAPPAGRGGMAGMAGMMEQHQRMMADHKAADDRLEALMKAAEDARGDAKVSALTAVVAELVRQHTAMHATMTQDHATMPMGRGRGMPTP